MKAADHDILHKIPNAASCILPYPNIKRSLTPYVENEKYNISRCGLHADNDIYRDREQHKSTNEWQCRYSLITKMRSSVTMKLNTVVLTLTAAEDDMQQSIIDFTRYQSIFSDAADNNLFSSWTLK
ncbi:unnamed protein product [Vicia faba]|uniref:Uncharacterized protein n=1 Tax=Vicia faba TaxID=3906 RepID=A0AAV0ZHQ1_VICFA|nr:unnamed protein product [Vicia faba]